MDCTLSAEPSGSGRPAAGDPPLKSLPMGIVVSLIVLAIIAGAAAGQVLHDTGWRLAWLIAIGLCAGLFGIARWLARSMPTTPRFLSLVGLTVLTGAYLMIIGGQSMLHPPGHDFFSFVRWLAMILTVMGLAVALPFLLALKGLLREAADLPKLSIAGAPLAIGWAIGIAGFVVTVMFVGLILWTTPRAWLLVAMVAFALGFPVLLLPVVTAAYQCLLSRWTVDSPPALSRGLETLYDRTGFAFMRTLCLDSRFGGGCVCMVILRPGRPTLVISESIVVGLADEELLALLAHEAAHGRLNHVWRKVAWAAFGVLGSLIVSVAISILIVPLVPRSFAVVGMLGALLPVAMVRGLYDTYVTRRHEAEADEYAADVAGAEALLGALESVQARALPAPRTHNRWTTHSTWERRVARIREREASRTRHGVAIN